ncbi:MAG: flippase-like domain-containing protein [Deltaproteobacteria bacterium]|nr:flippase-like domain-containing protein [Deltaproteobacteria bacterium]
MLKRLRRPLRHLITLALLVWVVRRISARDGLDALVTTLHAADVRWLLAAGLFASLAVVLGVLRFRLLLKTSGIDLPVTWLTRVSLEGRFVGAFTPSTAGLDIYRAVAVGRRTGSRSVAAGVIVIEKLLGLLGLVTLVFGLGLLGAGVLRDGQGALATLGLALGCGLGLALVLRPRMLERASARLPSAIARRVARLVDALTAHPPSRSSLFGAFGLGLLGHLTTAAVFLATSRALGIELPVVELLSLGVALVLSALLPISVGGVGVREGVAVMLLGSLGVAGPQAALVATLGWLLTQPLALVGGLCLLIPALAHAPDSAPVAALARATSPGSLASPLS